MARPSSRRRGVARYWLLVLSMIVLGGLLIGAALKRDESSGGLPAPGASLPAVAPAEMSSDANDCESGIVPPLSQEPSSRSGSPVAGEGLICLIIDDCGFNVEFPRRLTDLEIPMTFAILPRERHSLDVAALLKTRGYPAILHLPMQAERDGAKGPFLVGVNMEEEEISRTVATLLDEMPGLIGVNNHRGSLATADERVMAAVLKPIAERDLAFVDSRTSSRSVAFRKAQEMNVRSAYNSIFLDHEADHGFMERQWEQAGNLARRRGWVVVIGHVRPTTVSFFETMDPHLREGLRLVTLPELLGAIHPK